MAGSAAEEKPPTVASAPPRTTSPRTSGEDEGSTAGVPEASGTARNLEELFTDADEVAPVEDPELVADSEERELRRRNRRGTLLLFVTLLVVATAYGSGITDRLLLYVAGSAKTSVVPPPLAVDGAKGLRTDDTKVILDALREAPRDGDPIVVRVDTTPAAPRRDRSAVIHWTRGGSGEASLQGRAEFADLPLRFEILVETDPDATSGFTRMALITFEASPEPILEAPMFERIDPTTGARRAVEGTSVRVGIDRILYGFRADPTDGAADATRRSLFDFSFTLDSGRRMRIVLRPPSSD